METTNIERWNYYLRDYPSPQSYIDYAFYYMVSASLQRRVWISSGRPIYPNQYIIFVANPGVGKGLPSSEVNMIMKSYKLHDNGKVTAEQMRQLQEFYNKFKGEGKAPAPELDEELLFPMGPDAISYEALVNHNASSVRRHNVKFPHPCAPNNIYTNNPLCFILEELSSLFRKKMEDVVNYLIKAWDCDDYVYTTISRKTDRVRKTCLSLLGCTQPSFMKDVMEDNLLSTGFAARTLFLYEDRNRFEKWLIPPHDKDQLECKLHIMKHIRNLSRVFGELSYTPEAESFSKNFFETIQPHNRINADAKLDDFYSRKKIHVHKMSIAMHFADIEIDDEGQCDMVITLPTVLKALKLIESIENRMHVAIKSAPRNPLSGPTRKILRTLQMQGAMTTLELRLHFAEDVTKDELEQCISFLLETKQIETTEKMKDNKKVAAFISCGSKGLEGDQQK